MKRKHLTLGISLITGLLLAGITHADSPTTRPADPGGQPFKFNVPPNQGPLATPPGAVPHLFNGATYYTIPVNAQQP